ncbi:unnamed protein product [Rangifer tarandus platyrhynchus]|uniref:Uncharacterized protein n=1 Tax=Rangifer tarandus platyrhynchus TaxID=3082113 RepID=A0ABN8ZEX8_RANTA|nr:unnamed protein product [Rangifer tarandus platyrhynchus]
MSCDGRAESSYGGRDWQDVGGTQRALAPSSGGGPPEDVGRRQGQPREEQSRVAAAAGRAGPSSFAQAQRQAPTRCGQTLGAPEPPRTSVLRLL